MNEAEWIRTVRERSDIGEVISRAVRLVWRGSRGLGPCPFCTADRSTFSVDRERQLYHCFGCQADGDAFTFLMHRDSISFFEAAGRLADAAGVLIPDEIMKKIRCEATLSNETRQKLESLRARLAVETDPDAAARLMAEAEQTRWPK